MQAMDALLHEYEAAGALVAEDASSMAPCAESLSLLRARVTLVCDRARSALSMQGPKRIDAMLEAEKFLAAVLHVCSPYLCTTSVAHKLAQVLDQAKVHGACAEQRSSQYSALCKVHYCAMPGRAGRCDISAGCTCLLTVRSVSYTHLTLPTKA